MAITQAALTAQIDVPRNLWDPTEGAHSRSGERPLSAITGLEVHWAGTGGFEDHGDTETELLSFERYHEISKGWYDLFYNIGLDSEGFTYEGRDATIRSQSNLHSWLTFLVVAGPNDSEPNVQMYQRIYEMWTAIDPSHSSTTLRIHNERSATTCPGPFLSEGVKAIRAGWVPIPNEVKIMSKAVWPGVAAELAAADKRISDGSNPTVMAARWETIVMADRAYRLALADAKAAGRTDLDAAKTELAGLIAAIPTPTTVNESAIVARILGAIPPVDEQAIVDRATAAVLAKLDGTLVTVSQKASLELS